MMEMNRNIVFLLIVVLSICSALTAQTPSPTPAPVYKTYSAAMAAGKAASKPTQQKTAEAAYLQAAELAANDLQKADALLAAGNVQMQQRTIVSQKPRKFKSSSFVFYHDREALKSFNTALDLKDITDAKRAEITLERARLYIEIVRHSDAHNSLRTELETKFKQGLVSVLRKDLDALVAAATTPPDIKAEALICKARSYAGSGDVYWNASDLRSGYEALVAASKVVGAADHIKAEAFLKITDLARLVNDANSFYVAAFSVTKLPKAEPSQKFRAYLLLGEVLITSKKWADARKAIAEGLTLKGLTSTQLAELHREAARSFLGELAASKADKKQEASLLASARAEFAKAAGQPKLAADPKATMYMDNAIYIRQFGKPQDFLLAHEQLKTALGVPKLSKKLKEQVQYEIGETFRLEGKKEEARAAYLLVTNANPQYFGYSQTRIKDLDNPDKQGQ